MKHGIYSGGTFSVQPPPNFSFSNRVYYPRAVDMWEDKMIWENIKNKYTYGRHGTQAGAAIIEQGLNLLNLYEPGKGNAWVPTDMTSEEAQAIEDIMKNVLERKRLSLLRYSDNLSANKRGKQFEEHFAKIGEQLGLQSIRAGSKRVASPISVRIQIDLTGTGIGTGKFTHLQKNGFYNTILELIKEQLGEDFKERFGGGLELEIQKIVQGANGSQLGQLIVRQGAGTGKVDTSIQFKATGGFTSTTSELLNQMANELATHTFSLKNYTVDTLNSWGGVSLGDANKFRFYGHFFQGATKGTKQLNYADLCTFIYASENSNDSQVKRYLSWARYIYELTGLGQDDEVDYLIINEGTHGIVRVYSVKDLLSDMPNGDPRASYKNVLVTKGYGKNMQVASAQKFIFSVK